MRRSLERSIALFGILVATSKGAAVECDRWKSSPRGPPSLLSRGACVSLLVCCSLNRSSSAIELARGVRSPSELSILFSEGFVTTSRGLNGKDDHWRNSPRGPPSLLSREACASLLECWSFD